MSKGTKKAERVVFACPLGADVHVRLLVTGDYTVAVIDDLIELLGLHRRMLQREERASVRCDKCDRVSPNRGIRDQEGQACGEKYSADDPGCTGIMRAISPPQQCSGQSEPAKQQSNPRTSK